VENPKFVMLTRIDKPKDAVFAESSAAPLFGKVAKFLLDYWRIPPTR
jgi:cell division protein FtsI/penicillin-binding protein 2